MINTKNRLWKLVHRSKTIEEFIEVAISHASWYLRPYATTGTVVTRPWIELFWKVNKGV